MNLFLLQVSQQLPNAESGVKSVPLWDTLFRQIKAPDGLSI